MKIDKNIIAKETLLKIEGKTDEFIESINRSIEWINNSPNAKEKEKPIKKLKDIRRQTRKIKNAVGQKTTFAFYGVSQSGKSNLVKNLVCDKSNKLTVIDKQQCMLIDFIDAINPIGNDKESTAVVTRFTTDIDYNDGHLPVKIKLLSIKEIILSICNTYYSDFDFNTLIFCSEDIIFEKIKYIKSITTKIKNNYLSEDDILDIKEYLEKYLYISGKSLFDKLTNINFWDVLIEKIEYINEKDILEIFNILWGEKEEFKELFKILINNLSNLNYSPNIYANFDTVQRNFSGEVMQKIERGENCSDSEKSVDYNKEKLQGGFYSIMDIQTLVNFLFKESDVNFIVELEDKTVKEINPGILSGLSKEVVFYISKSAIENRPFIKNVDILDFPGVRGRDTLIIFDNMEFTTITDALLRGKLSYLFNIYSENFEINNLIVTNRLHGQMDGIKLFRKILNNWIMHYIGKTPEERYKTMQNYEIPPLFVILTFWNMLFINENKEGINVKKELQNTFSVRIKEGIKGNYTWIDKWIKRNGNYEKFYNFYLLRDFKYSKIFKRDENKIETDEIHDNLIDFYSDIEISFNKIPEITSLFKNPKLAWSESSVPRKDGSEYIIENLKKVSGNKLKVNRFINILNDFYNNVKNELNLYYHSDNADEQIKKTLRDIGDIQAKTNLLFGKNSFAFFNMIERMTLTERDVYELFYIKLNEIESIRSGEIQEYAIYLLRSPRINPQNTYNDNLKILQEDYYIGNLEETKKYFEEELNLNLNILFSKEVQMLIKKSTNLAFSLRNLWIETKLNSKFYEDLFEYGLNKVSLEKIFNKLIIAFDQLKIADKIADNISEYVDGDKPIEESYFMIADISSGIMNKFINTFGWEFFSDEQKDEILHKAKTHNIEMLLDLTELSTNDNKNKKELSHIIEYMDKYEENVNKFISEKNVEKITDISTLKNFFKWQEMMAMSFISTLNVVDYDKNSNNQLGKLLNDLAKIEFSLN